jgi:hypothetical protein
VRSSFLADYHAASLDQLNRDINFWIDQDYHQRIHSATGQTPFARFAAHSECLRCAPADLHDHFRKTVRRRVGKDRTVTIDGRLFEVPVGLIGKQVELRYHQEMVDDVEVFFNHQSHGFVRPVDLHVNCRVKRDKNNNAQLTSDEPPYTGGRLKFTGGSDEA